MATSKHPVPPREGEELDEETKRVLDRHAEYAEEDKTCISRGELLRQGLSKLKRAEPRP